jgi:threonine dehydrogenase-like Zn-dependent dehydrogenase
LYLFLASTTSSDKGVSMKALIFPGSGVVELVDKPIPEAGPGEILIRVRVAGVCGSDLHFMHASAEEQRNSKLGTGLSRDPYTTPGHEITGTVEAAGAAVKNFRVGDRVVVHHYSGCGFCRSCRMGWDTLCKEKVVHSLHRDGGFQEFVVADAKDCLAIPEAMSFSLAAFVSCGAGTSFQALRRGELKSGETVAAIGLGPVGLSALLWAKSMGCRTIGLDTSATRRAFATELGVDDVLDPTAFDVREMMETVTARGGADVTIETAGNSSGRSLALDATRVWGTAVFVGFGGTCEFDAGPQIVQRQITIKGSWMFSLPTLMDALDAAVSGNIGLDRIITKTCSIDDAREAIEEFAAGASGKTVIEMPGA